jgi:DNA-binding NtrC family response regulator
MAERPSVLIVEDEEPICLLLTYLLKSDLECKTVSSAGESLGLLATQFFNLVIADVGLPDMSGIELCRKVVERSPNTAVIIISGRSETEMVIEAMRAGAFDYITKPFDLAQVKAATERALRRRSSAA